MSTAPYFEKLKKETASGISELNKSAGIFSIFSSKIEPRRVLWAIRGFSVDLDESEYLSLLKSDIVESVSEDRDVRIIDTREDPEPRGPYTYGLKNIGVEDLNQENPSINGRGVFVGVIDTGIDTSHPDLKGRTIAWKDFVYDKLSPYDDSGHGTHVAGTIAGGNSTGTQIGVAPKAKLIVAKVFSKNGYATMENILGAMQWMIDPDGIPETADAPLFVNNSWGSAKSGNDYTEDPFYKMVLAWREAGIIPVFAAGNSGPNVGSVGIPGGFPNVIGIGAVDKNDKVASYSSRGPVSWKEDGELKEFIKPDFCAPGSKVFSTIPNGKHAEFSGTSMATPHVSGMLALMFQIKEDLTYDEVITLLENSVIDLGDAGKDNAYGSGRIDAKEVVEQLLRSLE